VSGGAGFRHPYLATHYATLGSKFVPNYATIIAFVETGISNGVTPLKNVDEFRCPVTQR